MIKRSNDVTSGELELHPEEVKGKTDTYASLTELYGVDIFTEEFFELTESVRKETALEQEKIENQLFNSWKGDLGVREDTLECYLFQENRVEAYLPSYQAGDNNMGIMEAVMIGIAIAAVIAIYIIFPLVKKRR